jgi:hypothetical protein
MTDNPAPESTRFLIDLGPLSLPEADATRIGDEMLRVVTTALASLDLAPREADRSGPQSADADSTLGGNAFLFGLPPGTYGYWFDQEVPGGPWIPRPLPHVDRHPF